MQFDYCIISLDFAPFRLFELTTFILHTMTGKVQRLFFKSERMHLFTNAKKNS